MKKKQEIVIRIQDYDHFSKYTSIENRKLVCVNVHDKFWGPCEVIDPMVKKFFDTGDNATKVDFISTDKEFSGELFHKHVFTSKPKYFILWVNL